MQFEPENYRSNTLINSLQQLASGIGGQLQQRKQRHETATGLQSLGYEPKQAEMLSGMNPQLLSVALKQHLMEPARQSNYEIARQMFGGGSQQPNNQQLSSMATDQGVMQQSQQQPNLPSGIQGLNLPEKGQMSDNDLRILQQMYGQQQNVAAKKDIAREKNALTEKLAAAKKLENEAEREWKKAENKAERESRSLNVKEKTDLGLKKEERHAKEEYRAKVEKFDTDIQSKTKTLQKLRNIKTAWETGEMVSGPLKQWADQLGLKNMATNPLTQSAGKEMWSYLLENTNNIKGFRSSDMMTNALMSSKPSEYNTKEGAVGILDTMLAFLDTDIKIDKLKKDNLAKYGENPLNAPIDLQKRIQGKINDLDANLEKKLSSITAKTAGYGSRVIGEVKKMDNPTTYNTMKDNKIYDEFGDGKSYVGSDGKRQRHIEVEKDEEGNVVRLIKFLD